MIPLSRAYSSYATTRAFPSSHKARTVYNDLMPPKPPMLSLLPLEKAIVEKLRNDGPCCLDEVVIGLPNFSWGQIFFAVDCMSRDGRVCLRKLDYSSYQISLNSVLA